VDAHLKLCFSAPWSSGGIKLIIMAASNGLWSSPTFHYGVDGVKRCCDVFIVHGHGEQRFVITGCSIHFPWKRFIWQQHPVNLGRFITVGLHRIPNLGRHATGGGAQVITNHTWWTEAAAAMAVAGPEEFDWDIPNNFY
jgi:hypothetical protein